MAVSQILTDLDGAVTNATTVMASATTLINGIGARVQAAVDKALENGATAEQLAPVQEEIDALKTSASALAQAVETVPGEQNEPGTGTGETGDTSRRR